MTSPPADSISRTSHEPPASAARSYSERTGAFGEHLRADKAKSPARETDDGRPIVADRAAIRTPDDVESSARQNSDETAARIVDSEATENAEAREAAISDDEVAVAVVVAAVSSSDETADVRSSADQSVSRTSVQFATPPRKITDASTSPTNDAAWDTFGGDPVDGSPIQPGKLNQFVEFTASDPAQLSSESRDPATDLQSADSASRPSSESAPVISRLSQQLLSSVERGQSPPPPDVDPSRFVHRVATAVQASRRDDGEISLRLSPPELGSLRVEVKVGRGMLTARIETETHSARTLLIDNLPLLRDRLAEQGIHIERFDVDVPDRQSGDLSNAASDQQRERSPTNHTQRNRESNAPSVGQPESGPQTQATSQLNVII